MIKLIKGATGCDVTVGQNGKVWISGKDSDGEIATKKIIEFIAENITLVGLTEKVENFIKNMGFKSNKVEIIKENTDEDSVEGDKE